jgi:hypothetical protein
VQRGCLEKFSFASGMPSLFLMFFKNKNRHNTVKTGKQENQCSDYSTFQNACHKSSFFFFFLFSIGGKLLPNLNKQGTLTLNLPRLYKLLSRTLLILKQ